jgi:hypothetical protein
VRLLGVRVQTKPVAGDIVDVRATVPVKPFSGATVTVDEPATPALTVSAVGAAVTVKSWTLVVTVAEWESVPLVPVTVTV